MQQQLLPGPRVNPGIESHRSETSKFRSASHNHYLLSSLHLWLLKTAGSVTSSETESKARAIVER